MVGMVFRSSRNLLVDPHFVDYLAGLSTGLAKHELDLVIRTASPGSQLKEYERLAASGSVDGIFVSAPEISDRRIATLKARKMPFVVHGCDGDNPDYAYYDVDNFGSFEAAAYLLADLGHKRIAVLNGPAEMAFSIQRTAGFQAAIATRNIRIPDCFSAYGEMSEEHAFKQASAMLNPDNSLAPTAFLCASTLQALGVMRAARAQGLAVPEDISLIAHDDVFPHLRSENFATPLTVARVPIGSAGKAMAEMMIALIEGVPPGNLQYIAPIDLIVRASTGPVPKTGGEPWR